MLELRFDNPYIYCLITLKDLDTLRIDGIVKDFGNCTNVEMFAANPIDHMMNFSGSGLPFPCPSIAFDNTPNYIHLKTPEFSVEFLYPNSYYTEDQWTRVPPCIFVRCGRNRVSRLELPERLPLRTLTYRPGRYERGPSYYAEKREILGVQTQEANLRQLGRAKIAFDVA